MAGHKASEENIYAAFDRSQLAEKTRVFTLAKALGVPSKELVVALSELGVVKVAQSTLTRAESEQLKAENAELRRQLETQQRSRPADAYRLRKR